MDIGERFSTNWANRIHSPKDFSLPFAEGLFNTCGFNWTFSVLIVFKTVDYFVKVFRKNGKIIRFVDNTSNWLKAITFRSAIDITASVKFLFRVNNAGESHDIFVYNFSTVCSHPSNNFIARVYGARSWEIACGNIQSSRRSPFLFTYSSSYSLIRCIKKKALSRKSAISADL